MVICLHRLYYHFYRMEFMCAAKKFGTEYDMRGLGAKKRQEEARTTVTMLEEKLDVLNRGNIMPYT